MLKDNKMEYGVIFIVGGVLVLLFGSVSRYASFEGTERYIMASLFFVLGIFLVSMSWLTKREVPERGPPRPGATNGAEGGLFDTGESGATLICPECGRPYNTDDIPDRKCPTCNVLLEHLEGFFERHPEFRD